MKYNVGDKVRIVSEFLPSLQADGQMDKHLGTIMTISRVRFNGYIMKECGDGWIFLDEDIEGLEFKRGDIVIDTDGDEVEFITDLGQTDNNGYKYVIKYDGEYTIVTAIFRKRTEIEKAIELLTREGKIKDGKILV